MNARLARFLALFVVFAWLAACGSQETAPTASAPSEPAAAPAPAAPPADDEPAAYDTGIVLALAQFIDRKPGPAQLEFLFRKDGEWQVRTLDDAESNVFHKAMVYPTAGGDTLLTLAGNAPEQPGRLKSWALADGALVPTALWEKHFGGKFSRMRDAEIGDLYGDGKQAIAVATHDQGVVAVLRPDGDGYTVEELDAKPNTFVHEIEIGDLDGDGVLEVYATPSEPNKLDGSPQKGEVVRYVPARGEGPTVVADLGLRHAKEILVEDVDGDGRDELYVSVEGHTEDKKLIEPVEIRRYEADTPADGGAVIATLDDQLCRFLTAGDIDGDGKREMVAAAYKAGVWLLRPGSDPNGEWEATSIDTDSGGFEHASILTDLDGDGTDELYVASDDDKAVRRYRWNGNELARETIYRRPDARPIFTWNLMPVPVDLIPDS